MTLFSALLIKEQTVKLASICNNNENKQKLLLASKLKQNFIF